MPTKQQPKERETPCTSCPYRKDAKLGFWDATHFTKLLADDADPLRGSLYHCHEDNKKPRERRDFCIGWALDQRKRNIPSILFRLHLMKNARAGERLEAFHANGARLYDSLREMVTANLRAIARTSYRGRSR